VGVAAQNAFGRMKFGNSQFDFPTSYGAGIALSHETSGLRVALDANFPNAYYKNMRGGAEWRWKDLAAVRVGYRTELGAPAGEALSGPTFGMGAGVHGVWLDYGYLISSHSESQHRIGMSFKPGHINWTPGDPYGQKRMPKEFKDPPAPKPAPSKTLAPKTEPKTEAKKDPKETKEDLEKEPKAEPKPNPNPNSP